MSGAPIKCEPFTCPNFNPGPSPIFEPPKLNVEYALGEATHVEYEPVYINGDTRPHAYVTHASGTYTATATGTITPGQIVSLNPNPPTTAAVTGGEVRFSTGTAAGSTWYVGTSNKICNHDMYEAKHEVWHPNYHDNDIWTTPANNYTHVDPYDTHDLWIRAKGDSGTNYRFVSDTDSGTVNIPAGTWFVDNTIPAGGVTYVGQYIGPTRRADYHDRLFRDERWTLNPHSVNQKEREKLEKAKETSMKLLKSWMAKKDFEALMNQGEVEIPSKREDNVTFIVKRAAYDKVIKKKAGKPVSLHCLISQGHYPDGDLLLQKILMLKTNEEEFMKIAIPTILAH